MADVSFYPTQIQQQYERDPRLEMARALMQQNQGQPVRTAFQGWANVLQGILGKYQQDKLQSEYGQKATDYRGHQAELAKALMGDQADPQTASIMQAMQSNPDTADTALPFAMNLFTARNAAALKAQERKDARADQRRTVDTGAEIITYDGNGAELSRLPKAIAPGTQAQLDASKANAAETRRHNLVTEAETAKNATTKSEKATQDQRQASFLISRLEQARSDISAATKESPSAAKPGVLASMAGALGDTPRNLVNDAPRQRVEAAQFDALDSALTLATGAAYTKEQINNLRRSYFPQLGDEPKTVEDKDRRFQQLIQSAYARAGNVPVNQPKAGGAAQLPKANAKGWTLHQDAQGNKAYVGPNGEVEEVQ